MLKFVGRLNLWQQSERGSKGYAGYGIGITGSKNNRAYLF